MKRIAILLPLLAAPRGGARLRPRSLPRSLPPQDPFPEERIDKTVFGGVLLFCVMLFCIMQFCIMQF